MTIDYVKEQLKTSFEGYSLQQFDEYELEDSFVTIADDLMENIFTFNKDWDMERCLTPYKVEPLDWHVAPNGDEEWTFMLNRMNYLSYLIILGNRQDKRYAIKAKDFILDWIKTHPSIVFSHSTRTLDTGMRLNNWYQALMYLFAMNLVSDDELDLIITSMKQQIEYLYENYLTKYTLSNWGSIQTCVLSGVIKKLYRDYENLEIYQWCLDEIDRQFAIQVYDDGMHWEQSTMYHVEVLHYLLIHLSTHPNETLSNIAHKMCEVTIHQMLPDGLIEPFGDSDRTAIHEIIHMASVVLDTSKYKCYGNPTFDIESIYALGDAMAKKYSSLPYEDYLETHYDGNQSGVYVMRNSWDRNAHLTLFLNGSIGSGHGHCDNLHVSNVYQGNSFLMDSGRFTYREDLAIRTELKDMPAHNTLVVDNNPGSVSKGSWAYEKFLKPLRNYVIHKDDCDYVEGSVILNNRTVHTRRVMFLHVGIWVIVDEVNDEGNHSSATTFNFAPEVKISKISDNDFVLENDETQLRMLVDYGTTSIDTFKSSQYYNQITNHQRITGRKEFKDQMIHTTILCSPEYNVTKVEIKQAGSGMISDEQGTAYRFDIDKDQSYIVATLHKEIDQGRNIMECCGAYFHAKSVLIHRNKDDMVISNLRG